MICNIFHVSINWENLILSKSRLNRYLSRKLSESRMFFLLIGFQNFEWIKKFFEIFDEKGFFWFSGLIENIWVSIRKLGQFDFISKFVLKSGKNSISLFSAITFMKIELKLRCYWNLVRGSFLSNFPVEWDFFKKDSFS